MKLLLLNYPYLAPELKDLGVEAVSAGIESDCDYSFSPAEYAMENILRKLPFAPDYIVYMDSLARVIPRGLEEVNCPLGMFCLDSTINRFWQSPLAEICDLVLCDQLPEVDRLKSKGMNARWFPLASDSSIYRRMGLERIYDITFIGNRNPETRIKRENILRTLANRFKMSIFDGNPPLTAGMSAEIYNRSKLTLNENLFPAVNLRLFEAMACGATVLTEDNAPGLQELFSDGEHIITYNPDNLLKKAERYLENDAARQDISNSAAEIAAKEHNLTGRAARLVQLLREISERKSMEPSKAKSALGRAFLGYGLKWQSENSRALENAGNYLRDALKADFNPETLMVLGLVHCAEGDFFEGVKLCMESAEISSGDFRPALYAGELLAVMGDRAESGRYLSLAAEKAGMECGESPGEAGFHLRWGRLLAGLGEGFEPGLMKYHLPMPFWSALEHLRRAGELNPVNWEQAGDILLAESSPDQAVKAYSAAGPSVSRDKLKAAQRAAYMDSSSVIVNPGREAALSLCMIVRNEEKNLKELLPGIEGIPDQIVAADTGSTDDTIETARRYGAEVISVPWEDDFAAARNQSLLPARGRYIIYLDADDRVDPEELRKLKAMLPASRDTIFYLRLVNQPGGETCLQRRVFPNLPELRFKGAVHEQLNSDAKDFRYVEAPLTIVHHGYSDKEALREKSERNLRIIEKELLVNPEDAYLHFHAASALQNLGRYVETIEHLKKAAFSDGVKTQQPEMFEHSLLTLARIFRRLGDAETALRILQGFLKEKPESALAHYYLGMIYFEEQLYSECRVMMESFFQLKLHPRGIPISVEKISGWGRYYLGKCLEHQGHFSRSAAEFIKAMAYLKGEAKLQLDTGRALLKAGDLEGAKKYLQLCLRNRPGDRRARELLAQVTAGTAV